MKFDRVLGWEESIEVRGMTEVDPGRLGDKYIGQIYTLPKIAHLYPDTKAEDWRQHPNGGGYVHRDSKVHEAAYLEYGCLVRDQSEVGPKARIMHRSLITGGAKVDRFDDSPRGIVEIYRSCITASLSISGFITIQDSVIGTGVTLQGNVKVVNSEIRDWIVCEGSTQRFVVDWGVLKGCSIIDSKVSGQVLSNKILSDVFLRKSEVRGVSNITLKELQSDYCTFTGELNLEGPFWFRGNERLPMKVSGQGSKKIEESHAVFEPREIVLVPGMEDIQLGLKASEEMMKASKGFFTKLPQTGVVAVNPETEFTHDL